jgi:hypothetical protein
MKYTKLEPLSLKSHPELNELWVQDRIAEDPSILGLGDLVLKDRERSQPRAGRLDLLLQDAESTRRFEVEVQLGATDESHLIRTLEYWDIERKRYPQYEHTAVIVAENITSRFLNVISLFNGTIPLVAIQMSTFRIGSDSATLVFTKVLDQVTLGLVDEDEDSHEVTDRNFWETRGSKKSLSIADKLLGIAQQHDEKLDLKYNKFYIGLAVDGQPNNFITMRPKKSFLRLEPRLPNSDETQERFEAAGLDVMDYDVRWGRYRIRLKTEDLTKHKKILEEIISEASAHANKD